MRPVEVRAVGNCHWNVEDGMNFRHKIPAFIKLHDDASGLVLFHNSHRAQGHQNTDLIALHRQYFCGMLFWKE